MGAITTHMGQHGLAEQADQLSACLSVMAQREGCAADLASVRDLNCVRTCLMSDLKTAEHFSRCVYVCVGAGAGQVGV